MKYSIIAFACVGVAACAGAPRTVAAPPAPAPVVQAAPPPVVQPTPPTPPSTPPASEFNPEGNYDLQITFGGAAMPVALEMWRENGQWRGTVGNQNLGSADITAVAIDGRKVRVTAVSQAGPTFVLNLDVKADNTVTGDWSGNNDGSRLTGKKIK